MKVKRIVAKNMKDAIRQIRETLGDDAAILSDKKLGDGIEVVAAIDYDGSIFNAERNQIAPTEKKAPIPPVDETKLYHAVANPAEKVASHEWIKDPVLVNMQQELNVLRGLLQDQLAGFAWSRVQTQKPAQAVVFKRLKKIGFKSILCRKYAERITQGDEVEQAWSQTLSDIQNKLPVVRNDIIEKGGVIALLGTTGVGKTTTIAKLAALAAQRYGQQNIAIICGDNHRIAAAEQLRVFGTLLGISIHSVSDNDSLRATLRNLASKRIVLIDTAGISQADEQFTRLQKLLNVDGIDINKYLLLSATSHLSNLEKSVKLFSIFAVTGVILTKIDECTSLGNLFSVLLENQLPLNYICNGQKVPGYIEMAESEKILQLALSFAKQHGVHELEQSLALAYESGANINS